MTTEDSAVSIDFLTSYQIYENLTTKLLLAYLVTDFDKRRVGTGLRKHLPWNSELYL